MILVLVSLYHSFMLIFPNWLLATKGMVIALFIFITPVLAYLYIDGPLVGARCQQFG